MTPASSPTVAVVTDLWPSESEPISGTFVFAEVAALHDAFRQVVLVPSLVLPGLHRRVWHGAVQGSQHGWRAAPPPGRLLRYSMARLPRSGEVGARTAGIRVALRRARERPSLVHGHFLLSVAPAAVAVARSFRVPAIVTAHGTDVRWLAEGGIQRRHRMAMLQACRAADRVIAVSAEAAGRLVGAGVPTAKIEVMPMGVDADRFRPRDRGAARAELGIGAEARVVLFVGRLTREKGADVLARALDGLDGVECLAAGTGESPSPRIRALGVLGPDMLARALAAADVLCLPSFAEGMPVAVGEALAAGRPVVASRVGGIPEYVVEGRNGYLTPPGDAEALAAALRRAIDTEWSAEEIRSTSEPLWWSTVGPRLEALYTELLT